MKQEGFAKACEYAQTIVDDSITLLESLPSNNASSLLVQFILGLGRAVVHRATIEDAHR